MIDTLAVQVSDANADTLPTYDEAYIRLNAGLSAEQGGALDPYLDKAIKAFQVDTQLKVYRHTYRYQFRGEALARSPRRNILVPGLDCSVVYFRCDGTDVDSSEYETLKHAATGSAILRPAQGYWHVDRKANLDIQFTAGVAALPADLQSLLADRIKFDTYGDTGDLLRWNEEKRRYAIGTIVWQ